MTEYGIFNDEGCIEAGFYSEDEAHRTIVARYPEGDDYQVLAVCHDHEGEPAEGCEICNADEDENEGAEGAREDEHG